MNDEEIRIPQTVGEIGNGLWKRIIDLPIGNVLPLSETMLTYKQQYIQTWINNSIFEEKYGFYLTWTTTDRIAIKKYETPKQMLSKESRQAANEAVMKSKGF